MYPNQLRDLHSANASHLGIARENVFPSQPCLRPRPLVTGSECFADGWIARWHSEARPSQAFDVSCFSVDNAQVYGSSLVQVDKWLITSPEVMPPYVYNLLKLDDGGSAQLADWQRLPERIVKGPCAVIGGHGTNVYGHFLIEMFMKCLILRRTSFEDSDLKYLVDRSAPAWLLEILSQYLNIEGDRLETFDPSTERVRVERAIVPGRVLQSESYHPATNILVDNFKLHLGSKLIRPDVQRIFVVRGRYQNPSAPRRMCLNEQDLIDIAVHEFGFEPIMMQHLSWLEQISLFSHADFIVGQAGSGLHNSIFSAPNSCLASIGFMNFVQSQIGTLRGQYNAFMSKGIRLDGDFSANGNEFAAFLDVLLR